MVDDILVPTDGSPGIERPIGYALELASAETARIHALAVTDTRHEPPDISEADRRSYRAAAEAAGQAAVDHVRELASDRSLTATGEIRVGAPEDEILAAVDHHDVDLVTMGLYAAAADEWPRLGSTTERVISHGDVPVLAVEPGEEVDRSLSLSDRMDDVLLATDGSDSASRAATNVIDVAAAAAATLHVLYVLDPEPYQLGEAPESLIGVLEEGGRGVVEDVARRGRERGLDVETTVHRGRPAQTILGHAADVDADMIGLGTEGSASLSNRLLGSTTARVLRRADGPVLVSQ